MDFNFDEEQRLLRDTARKFFEKEVPKSVIRELLHDKNGYSYEMWEKMGELGWMGLPFEEEYGGWGGSFSQLCILFEEMGRAAVPSPYFSTVILSGLLLQDFGQVDVKKEYLPKIATGEKIFTLALVGNRGFYHREEVGLKAEMFRDSYLLNGSAFFVPYGHIADYILCVARTQSGSSTGITIFVVEARSRGIEAVPLETMTGSGSECVVTLKDVEVSQDQVIGEPGNGWEYIEKLWPKIAVVLSCECVGGMDKVMDLTLNHVDERIQFGRPLSKFQVVQHMCVDMLGKVETSKHTAYYAAWLIDQKIEWRKEAAIAKAWCGEAFKDVTKSAHELVGALGFSEEFDLHLYTKNAKKLELLFGDGTLHRSVVAEELGL
jgi:alkylation response protein AidB-like acyl-CoA dehydrogenase